MLMFQQGSTANGGGITLLGPTGDNKKITYASTGANWTFR